MESLKLQSQEKQRKLILSEAGFGFKEFILLKKLNVGSSKSISFRIVN